MQFNINVQRSDGKGGLNLNVVVEAPDAVSALDAAKDQLLATIEASGLTVAPAPPAPASPAAKSK